MQLLPRLLNKFRRFYTNYIYPYSKTKTSQINTAPEQAVTYQVMGIQQYCAYNTQNTVQHLSVENSIYLKQPNIISKYPRKFFSGYVRLPDLYLAELNDVFVYGRTEFITYDSTLLSDELAYYDYTHYILKSIRDILHFDYTRRNGKFAQLNLQSQNAAEEILTFECAIHFCHEYSCNYYHFLIELIPRLLILQKTKVNIYNVPVLIDANLPIQFYQALELYFGTDTQFIKLHKHQKVLVKHLYFPSFLSVCHDLPIDKVLCYEKDFVISPIAVNFLKDPSFLQNIKSQKPFRKILILRTDTKYGRKIKNMAEIQEHALALGFETISPEQYSFQEQQQIFSDASAVIAIGGAALTNIIFCSKKTKILMMCHDYINGNPYIYSSIADILDLELKVLYGYAENRFNACTNFYVPIDEFKSACLFFSK